MCDVVQSRRIPTLNVHISIQTHKFHMQNLDKSTHRHIRSARQQHVVFSLLIREKNCHAIMSCQFEDAIALDFLQIPQVKKGLKGTRKRKALFEQAD
jgi:hypothetical protein